MNQVMLVGKIKSNPVFKSTNSGNTICLLTVEAEKSFYGDTDEKPELFQVVLWSKLIELHRKNLKPKTIIAISGHLKPNNFEKDNEIYYKSNLIADKISYL